MAALQPSMAPAGRRPSGGRPPPTFAPGMPVRAEAARTPTTIGSKQPLSAQFARPANPSPRAAAQSPPRAPRHSQYGQPNNGSPHAPRKMSIPAPSPKTVQAGQFRQNTYRFDTASRPSPDLSSSSHSDSLRETTRTNIPPAPRRGSTMDSVTSGTSTWEKGIKSPQEPVIETPKEIYESRVQVNEMDAHFDQLLDSLQIPDSVRRKFDTVSPDVKTSLLTSSLHGNPAILNALGLPAPPGPTPKVKKRLSTPLLRKAKSSSSLGSPGPDAEVGKTYRVDGDQFVIVASPLSSPNPMSPTRGRSIDTTRPPTSRQSTGPGRPMSSFFPSSSTASLGSVGRKYGLGITMGEQPDAFVSWLKAQKGTDLNMSVDRCKKLRMLLRHETTQWVGSFVEMGGYELVLARLQDLFDVEWREEQHDDQMLYELLRCVKALSTSEVGKAALRHQFPRPFPDLSKLLFSEKKPGDLASRQIIVELWVYLFELFAPIPTATSSRPTSLRFDDTSLGGPSRRPVDIVGVMRELLVPEEKENEQHTFITQAHRPRVFKAWVQELSDICRDYFWIMCHGSNTLWALDEVDESLVEKPVAPGGATGGVEFEAMNYVTTHFKLLNTLCKAQATANREKATQLHYDLLVSGMDRILVTLRKASTTYYPTLHLELARYVTLLRAASPSGRLPHLIDKLVGPPPEHVRRKGSSGNFLPVIANDGGRRGAWDPQV